MKNFKLYLLAAAGCLAMTSCSSDDDEDNNSGNASLVGTYELTSAVTPLAQDFDGDGDASTNLVTEGACYNDSWIAFHADGTYDESYSYSTISNGGVGLTCQTDVSSGTYTLSGSTVTTTRTSGTGAETATYSFNVNNHKLLRMITNAPTSVFNTTMALWATGHDNLELTFERYTENDEDAGATDDDANNTNTAGAAEVTGRFELTSLITGSTQDLDDDGDSSTDLTNEVMCYGDSNILFHTNGTYEETRTWTTVGNVGQTLDCNTESHTGTYTRTGGNVYTRSADGINTAYTYNTTTHYLKRTETAGSIPTYNSTTNLYGMTTGNLDYEYSKAN
ncbi:lipocalin family protein [Flavobacterium magnum]|nr:lipocalin family protein [Flavobacterium magnum]